MMHSSKGLCVGLRKDGGIPLHVELKFSKKTVREKRMEDLYNEMRLHLPPERMDTITATLYAYKFNAISEALADVFMRYALMNSPHLLREYDALMRRHKRRKYFDDRNEWMPVKHFRE